MDRCDVAQILRNALGELVGSSWLERLAGFTIASAGRTSLST
jgi:hypothetical protein